MGCDPESGIIRELNNESEAKTFEKIFKYGELITIKGCLFSVQQIVGEPHNTITFRSIGMKAKEDNMI